MRKKFFSGVKYKIQILNQERFLSGVSKKIKLFYVSRLSHTQTELYIKPRSQKLFENELKSKNIKILESKNTFLFSFFKNFIKKTGVIVGLVFSLILFFVANQFVFQTSFIGLETINKTEILQVLSQNKYNGFSFKPSINTKKLEKEVAKTFDKISLVSIIIKGNTLVVSVKEKISAGEYDNPEEFEPLKAKFDGLITDIKLISGTIKVKVGQIVKVGDVLVEPYIIDSSNQKRVVKADAEISARVWLKAKETHFENRIEIKRTGNVKKHTKLYFLGIEISNNLKDNNFEFYETETKARYISQNNILPIVKEDIIFYETEEIKINEQFESVKEDVFLKVKQKALQMLEEYDIITKEYSTVYSNFGVTNVEYVIEINKLIS